MIRRINRITIIIIILSDELAVLTNAPRGRARGKSVGVCEWKQFCCSDQIKMTLSIMRRAHGTRRVEKEKKKDDGVKKNALNFLFKVVVVFLIWLWKWWYVNKMVIKNLVVRNLGLFCRKTACVRVDFLPAVDINKRCGKELTLTPLQHRAGNWKLHYI